MTAKGHKKDGLSLIAWIACLAVSIVSGAAGLETCTHIIDVYKPALASVTALAAAFVTFVTFVATSALVSAAITEAWLQRRGRHR